MAPVVDWQRSLQIAAETTWAQPAVDPDYYYLPYSRYDVQPRVVTRVGELFAGVRQRTQVQPIHASLSGMLECPLYSHWQHGQSLAETLLSWAIAAPATAALPSQTAYLAEPGIDDRQQLGLWVRRMQLAGSVDKGIIELSLELEGESEVGEATAPPLPSSPPAPRTFLIHNAEVTLGDSNVLIASFRLSIDHQIVPVHLNSYWPTHLLAGIREIDLELTLVKEDASIDEGLRSIAAETTATLQLKGIHGGTGPVDTSWTVVTLQFDRLQMVEATTLPTGTPGNEHITLQQVRFQALKPASDHDDITVSFTTE